MSFGKRFASLRAFGARFLSRGADPGAGGTGTLYWRKSGSMATANLTQNAVGDRLWAVTMYAPGLWAEVEVLVTSVDATNAGWDVLGVTVLRGPAGITLPPDTVFINKGPEKSVFLFGSADGESPAGDDAPWFDARITGTGLQPWLTEKRVLRQGNLLDVLDFSLRDVPQLEDDDGNPITPDPYAGIAFGWDLDDLTKPRIVGGRPDNYVFDYDLIATLADGRQGFGVYPKAASSEPFAHFGSPSYPYIAVLGDGSLAMSPEALFLDSNKDIFAENAGVLLLGPHAAMTSTTWTTAKNQVATIAGGYRKIAGWWPGTTALVTLPTAESLCDNPGAESSSSQWDSNNLTIARVGDDSLEEDYCFELTWDSDGDAVFSLISMTRCRMIAGVPSCGSRPARPRWWGSDVPLPYGSMAVPNPVLVQSRHFICRRTGNAWL